MEQTTVSRILRAEIIQLVEGRCFIVVLYFLLRDSRYQGFGNVAYQQHRSQGNPGDQPDLLSGAMSSLSVGWSMLSKGATGAAEIAKDLTSQAGQKAAEFTEKDGSGLLAGFGSIASKASEIGQKSWGGISSFVKSPSIQGLAGTFNKGYVAFGFITVAFQTIRRFGISVGSHWN